MRDVAFRSSRYRAQLFAGLFGLRRSDHQDRRVRRLYLHLNEPRDARYREDRLSERDVSLRVEELSNHTGVASPFEEEARFAVSDPVAAESLIHAKLSAHRVSANREFFRIAVSDAIEIVAKLVGEPLLTSTRIERQADMDKVREQIKKEGNKGVRLIH